MKKIDKSVFHQNGISIDNLPKECRNCFGYSNWNNPVDKPYEEKDCSDCLYNPLDDVYQVKE